MAGAGAMAGGDFGDELGRWRRAAGLAQEELAERAGVSARAVSDLERGQRRAARRETAQLLADALGLASEDRSAFLAAAHRPAPAPDRAAGAGAGSSRFPGAALPIPLDPLVGRDAEAAAVGALL
ncbi:MAG TPA: helix-turn-helix transcriptional regulator, partial [Thermomicrobiales bacterium]|nr:helix-turn-helix transcriptional regulator [Thermomicrobiales bacterium]